MEWINVKDRLPGRAMMIVYCSNIEYLSAIGLYWADPDDPRGPVPSCPDWLTWDKVTHWFELKEPIHEWTELDSCKICKNEKVACVCMEGDEQ